jgi:hypothetical protein
MTGTEADRVARRGEERSRDRGSRRVFSVVDVQRRMASISGYGGDDDAGGATPHHDGGPVLIDKSCVVVSNPRLRAINDRSLEPLD